MNTPFDPETPPRRSLVSRLRASFLTGLVVIAPVGLTIWLIWSVVGWIDGFVLPLVPQSYHPDRMIQDLLGLDPSVQINVRGLGVVGEQPLLNPGDSFEYTSGTAISSSVGSMKGSYQMVAEDGHHFDVAIPEFILSVPRILH